MWLRTPLCVISLHAFRAGVRIQVCVDAFFKMGKTVQRIQPESKMPEEEEPTKRPGDLERDFGLRGVRLN